MQNNQKSKEIEDLLGKISSMHIVHRSTAVFQGKEKTGQCVTQQCVTASCFTAVCYTAACYSFVLQLHVTQQRVTAVCYSFVLHGQRICSDGQCGLAPPLCWAKHLQLTFNLWHKLGLASVTCPLAKLAVRAMLHFNYWGCVDKIKMCERQLTFSLWHHVLSRQ